MAKIRTCMVDGTQYTYCPRCGSDNPNETWRFLYCSEKCRKIYHVIDDFNHDKISMPDAKAQLEDIGLIDNLTKVIKEDYNKIIESSIVNKRKNKKTSKNEEIVNDLYTGEIKMEDTSVLPDSTLL